MTTDFELYKEPGQAVEGAPVTLPLFQYSERLEDPSLYLPDKGLKEAVNVALALGQPLLVAGEPGTGKTQLAASIAWSLGCGTPLRFQTKTTSVARDLFYRYDSLRHFHDAQLKREQLAAQDYISFEALGRAILMAMPSAERHGALPAAYQSHGQSRSVVLIDEIDKAPRDLPNDILNELESMTFSVPEMGGIEYKADPAYRPVIVLTSNSERNLPDAFLRRCVFYYIPFPDRERLKKIIIQRLEPDSAFTPVMLDAAITHFEQIRGIDLVKRPATAEFLAWARILARMKIDLSNLRPGQHETLAFTYSAIAKTKEDLARLVAGVGPLRNS